MTPQPGFIARLIPTKAAQFEPLAGHRTTAEHDCFTMNCRGLGPQVRDLHEALANCSSQLDLALTRCHVPTPEELDALLSDISAAAYASEAREIVENWTRKWWSVESAFTTKWNDASSR